MNKKGAVGIMTVPLMIAVTIATTATVGTGLTALIAGKEQAKKNSQSIWAHMQGLCTGENPDARCINK